MPCIEPKVSVILTSYNKPLFLKKAIESVLNQTMTEWELWIMDDHSNFETVEMIQHYLGDPRIFYRNSEIKDEERYQTTRYATMINEAISLSKGQYLTYLTDDTIYVPTRLEEMVAFIEENPGVEIVYSSQQVKVVNEQMIYLREFIREAKENLTHAADIVDHCSVMHTREIVKQVQEQFGSYWDDDLRHWCRGDAVFWQRLNIFQPFYSLSKVLDITYKTPQSVQTLFQNLPAILPDGLIVKGMGKDVYVIEEGKRRLLQPEMLTLFKYDPRKIVTLPDPFLFQYEEGEEVDLDNRLPCFRLYQDEHGKLFYLERKKKRPIVNLSALRRYRFNMNEIVQIHSVKLKDLANGPPIDVQLAKWLPENRIYRHHNRSWILLDSQFHAMEQKVLARLKFLDKPVHIPRNILKQYEMGQPFK
ncbi:glycosyltransferase family A protein [Lederbergia galactosidilytica]|uniref:glycosyltransferase family A protein n=1 Tax=Lederbergia galactosidilytica TaxID=217031 RepID=UPI000A8BD370|nr:glycosyltransferase family A protein [Lederbergia galactosidilytica]